VGFYTTVPPESRKRYKKANIVKKQRKVTRMPLNYMSRLKEKAREEFKLCTVKT